MAQQKKHPAINGENLQERRNLLKRERNARNPEMGNMLMKNNYQQRNTCFDYEFKHYSTAGVTRTRESLKNAEGQDPSLEGERARILALRQRKWVYKEIKNVACTLTRPRKLSGMRRRRELLKTTCCAIGSGASMLFRQDGGCRNLSRDLRRIVSVSGIWEGVPDM